MLAPPLDWVALKHRVLSICARYRENEMDIGLLKNLKFQVSKFKQISSSNIQ